MLEFGLFLNGLQTGRTTVNVLIRSGNCRSRSGGFLLSELPPQIGHDKHQERSHRIAGIPFQILVHKLIENHMKVRMRGL